MSRDNCQYKILAVERILQENPNGVTVKEILLKLDYEYGAKAERKSIYSNIDVLGWFLPIQVSRNQHGENVYKIKGV